MTKKQIKEFLERLEGKEGCDFTEDKKGEITWKCDSKTHKLSEKILTKMGVSKKEQKEFLKKCEDTGGYCDCEIIFNSSEHLI